MNHCYLVVCFINIIVFSVNSAPTSAIPTASNIFDLIQNYSAKNCPALSKNIVIDKNTSYLSPCRDVSLEKVPANIAFDSMNAYLCVAILEADFRLCNALSNESYTNLAKSYEDLRESITSARNNPVGKMCTAFNNFTAPFNNSSDIGVKLAPWMSKFNEQLFGPGCSILCADFGDKTNVFCSLLFYINAQVQNVQRVIQQRKVPLPKVSVKANLKAVSAERDSIPLEKPQVNAAPAPQAHEAAKVQPIVEQQINTTTIVTTPTIKHNLASADKENKSQSQTKSAVGLEQDDDKMAAKLPAAADVVVGKEPVVKPKESDQTEKEHIDEKLPGAAVENSAPEAVNTAADNKFKPEKTAAKNRFEPEKTAAKNKFESVNTAAENKFKSVNTADKNKFEWVNTADEKKFESVNTADEKKMKPVNTAAEKKMEPVNTADEKKMESVNTAAENNFGSVNTADEKKMESVNTADENKFKPVKTADEMQFEPVNTDDEEKKFETPETNDEAANRDADIETTGKVVKDIFDTTVFAGLKEQKPESYPDDDDDDTLKIEDTPGFDKEPESAVPVISDQSITPREYDDVEDSNFFAYFMFVSVLFIAGYVLYHNKQKILALVLEGRRDRNSRRRPNTASYRKLNSNLEEAVTSKCSGSAAHVIY